VKKIRVLTWIRNVTDRQKDKQTDWITTAYIALVCNVSSGKNRDFPSNAISLL